MTYNSKILKFKSVSLLDIQRGPNQDFIVLRIQSISKLKRLALYSMEKSILRLKLRKMKNRLIQMKIGLNRASYTLDKPKI
jgi:hypothetical protein